MQKSGGLLSLTNYVCFCTLLFPQHCTGNTHSAVSRAGILALKCVIFQGTVLRYVFAQMPWSPAPFNTSSIFIFLIPLLQYMEIFWGISLLIIFRSIKLKNIVSLWNPRTISTWLKFLVNNYCSKDLRLASFNLFKNCFIHLVWCQFYNQNMAY